jgi:fibronectin-binding autotransporter adhesin
MKPRPASRFLTKSLFSFLAFGAFANISYAQTTRTWDGGGVPATNMDIAANWSGDAVPDGATADTAQWDGSVPGPLSLTFTAAGTGAPLGAIHGIFLNITGGQTSPLTINEFSGTAGLRIQNLTVAPSAGAVTFGGTAGTDNLVLGSSTVVNHTWTNDSSNPVTFGSDVAFGAGQSATHALTLTGMGNWNVNGSLIRSSAGTINVIKDGSGTMNLGTVNAAGNATFTITAGTIDNTSGAAMTLTGTTKIFNGDFSFSTPSGVSPNNDLSLGTGTVSLGPAAGTSRTITTNGAGLLTVPGVISNGTNANSLIKNGTGALKLDSANTFTGGVTLNTGTLHINNNGALGAGQFTINGGTILARNGGKTVANATAIGGDFTIGSVGNSMNFSGAMNLGGATRTVTFIDGSPDPDSTISGVISNGGLTKAGPGTLVLSANNTFAGPTAVTGGALRLTGSGAINSSSGITIDGADAKLVQLSSVASAPAITLTQGTLDGTGTVGAVNVGGGGAAILANGNGSTSTLTTGALNFTGPGTVNLASTTSGVGIAAGDLTTSGTNSSVMINLNRTGPWSTGRNNLISYTSFPSADINDFDFTIINGPTLGARQTVGDLVLNGNNIALEILGTTIYWTGLQSNQWTVNPIAGSKNWKQTSNNAATDFLDADEVVFNDTPGTNQTVQIDDNDVNTTTTTFNNSTVDYTLASSSTFGIGGFEATFTKSGSASVTLNTNNSYSGSTTLNAGTLNVNTATALGSGAVVINGGTLNNTSGAPVVLTNNQPQSWNGDFTFTGSNDLDMGSGTVTLASGGDVALAAGGAGDILTVGEIKSSSQGLSVTGGGTLVATSIGSFGAGSNIGGTLTVGSGTTLQINRSTGDSDGTTGDFVATGLAGSGTITNGAAVTARSIQINTTGDHTFSGTIANGGAATLALNKQGTGTLTLTGSSSYTGQTVVGGGILNVRNSNALGGSEVRVVSRNGGIQLQDNISLPPTVTFTLSNDGTGAVPYAIANVSGDNTIHGNINLTTGGGGTAFQSDGGVFTVTGNITIAAGQTSRGIVLQGTSTAANLFSGVLSDLSITSVASLIKSGPGTWTVTGASTYTGTTAVNAGTLIISGNHTAATGTLTVAANATLGGLGALGGNVTFDASGIHSLPLAATSGAQVPRTIGGALTHTAGSVLNLTAAGAPAPGVYTLVTANGGIAGLPTLTGFTGGTLSLSGDSKSLLLTISSGTGYDAWATSNGLTGANNGATQDADFDGISNILEYVLGGIPVGAGAGNTSILPTQTLTATDLILTFKRSDLSESDVTLKVQWSANMIGWNDFATVGAGDALPAVDVTEDSPTADVDTVVVTIPRSLAPGKIFARLQAVK